MSNNKKRFPLFHVPHDGTTFPEELMESVCIPKEQFLSYHERMRDTGVLEMVPTAWRNSGNTLYFPVSRLLCDVERFSGPEEPMERLGMGFCYERAYDGTRIKTVSAELRRETLVWYHGHHEKLNRACIEHPRLLLLDMHSFSDDIVPRDRLRSGERTPDVCLGIDEKYTPPGIVSIAEFCLRAEGFVTARNFPYSGSLVPNAVLGKEVSCDCASIMLEWNKRVYCNERGIPDAGTMEGIRQTVSRIAELSLDSE